MNTKDTVHTPVRLLKNRRYPTYQLYAVTRSKKAPETVLFLNSTMVFSVQCEWHKATFSVAGVFTPLDTLLLST